MKTVAFSKDAQRSSEDADDHRGLSARALAEAAKIAPAFLSQIETGKRAGTTETLLKLAKALGVLVEDIAAPRLDAT